jgi:hypothetical protein
LNLPLRRGRRRHGQRSEQNTGGNRERTHRFTSHVTYGAYADAR